MKTAEEHVAGVCQKYLLEAYVSLYDRQLRTDKYEFQMDCLPILPFFMDLATEFLVPIENIVIEHERGSSGCPTCGYGSECTYKITITL